MIRGLDVGLAVSASSTRRRLAERFGDRAERVGVAVGEALAGEHARAELARRDLAELAGEAALADAGVADEQHELRALAGWSPSCARPRSVASSASRPTSGDRCAGAAPAGRGERVDRAERLDRLVAAPQRDRPERLVADRLAGRGLGGGPDDHLAGRAELLEALRGVHDVAHGGGVAAGAHRAHQHLAAVHADPDLHRDLDLGGDARAASPACAARRAPPARRRPRGRSGAPKRAMISSPTILSSRPPKSVMSATSRSKQWSTRRLTCSGSAPAEIVVKPTRSAISTVTSRRSSSEAPRRWPHSWQNRAPAAVVAPQAGQVMGPRYRSGPTAPSAFRRSAAPRAFGIQVGAGLPTIEEDSSGEGTRMERTQPKGRKDGATPRSARATRSRRRSTAAPVASDVQVGARRAPAARVRRRDRRRRGLPVRARQRPLPRAVRPRPRQRPRRRPPRRAPGRRARAAHHRVLPGEPRRPVGVVRRVARRRPPLAHGRDRADARGLGRRALPARRRARRLGAQAHRGAARAPRPPRSAHRAPEPGDAARRRSPTRWRRARARTTPRRVGLVLLDLDHFKIVNDSLGLSAGDELFAVVAQRVERILRAGDTVARLGGDELAVVCNDAQDERDAIAVAERVRSVLAEPFALATGEVFLTASIGVALSNGDGRHARAPAARRERRDVRGEEAGPRPDRGVRRADARARGRAARDRSRRCGGRSCTTSSACTTSRSCGSSRPR